MGLISSNFAGANTPWRISINTAVVCNSAKAAFAAAMILFGMGNAHAQSRASTSTQVLTPITVGNNNDLNFGNIVPGSAQSIIRINRNNGAIAVQSGNAVLFGGTVERAEFLITGDPFTRVQISLPRSLELVRSGGTETMRVNRFRMNGNGGRIARRNIDDIGSLSVLVSAQLRVRPQQAAGIYRGTYEMTVEYN